MLKELSIFIDESGDFGKYYHYCPYYIVSMVFHEQVNSISSQINILDNFLNYNNLSNHTIHTAPLIRQEQSYKDVDIEIRSKIFKQLFNFIRNSKIKYKTLVIDRKICPNQNDLIIQIKNELSLFFRDNLDYFVNFDNIIIYYDNGQMQLKDILNRELCNYLSNYEMRTIIPDEYKLFQVADFVCTVSLIESKIKCGKGLTNSERIFFGSEKKFYKNTLKSLEKLKF